MNCKPGQLAWIIRDDAGDGRNLGLVVKVAHPSTPCSCSHCAQMPVSWHCVSQGRKIIAHVFVFTVETMEAEIPDAWLKPFPEDGDGVSDEEVRELYAPSAGELTHG